MSDTTMTITIDNTALTKFQRDRIRSVDIQEAQDAQTQISIVAEAEVGPLSNWTTPLDPLLSRKQHQYPAFTVRLDRGQDTLTVLARPISASWSLTAGASSTLTVAGLDTSTDLDQVQVNKSWDGTGDSAIARTLLGPAAKVTDTGPPDGGDHAPVRQLDTDWGFLRKLARRNNYDVYLEYTGDPPEAQAYFGPIKPTAQSWTLDLGYGALGGTASAEVQLMAGQHVRVAHAQDSTSGTQILTENPPATDSMGTRFLGNAVTVQLSANDADGIRTPENLARVREEQTAFAATLTVTLSDPSMPLIRARRMVLIRGLGSALSGLWLVKSVRHSISQGGHTQALTLARNALGDGSPDDAQAAAGAADDGTDIGAAIAATITAAVAEAAGARASVL
jgi:phage protein D